jgi:hypothetical protein
MKTIPVDTGAGRIRIRTETPLCNPTPAASTARQTVVSKRKARFLRHMALPRSNLATHL